jgi:RHS repeat-associated protein
LNTPRLITNAANQTVWKLDNNDPFGANMPNENPVGLGVFTFNLRFPGQYFDRETGLHYNRFRTYDPASGRYIESDPLGLAAGFNTYAYVSGNPLSRTDPLGLFDGSNVGATLQKLLEPVAETATKNATNILRPLGAALTLICFPGNGGQSSAAACADDPRQERKECRNDDDDACMKNQARLTKERNTLIDFIDLLARSGDIESLIALNNNIINFNRAVSVHNKTCPKFPVLPLSLVNTGTYR